MSAGHAHTWQSAARTGNQRRLKWCAHCGAGGRQLRAVPNAGAQRERVGCTARPHLIGACACPQQAKGTWSTACGYCRASYTARLLKFFSSAVLGSCPRTS
eukprot:2444937-Amphidinium_carterae.1